MPAKGEMPRRRKKSSEGYLNPDVPIEQWVIHFRN